MMFGYGNEFGCFSSMGGMGMFLVILVIAVVAIYLVTKKGGKKIAMDSKELLDIKYASGDLTKEEYEEKKRVLK